MSEVFSILAIICGSLSIILGIVSLIYLSKLDKRRSKK